jgi:hypothetical protein
LTNNYSRREIYTSRAFSWSQRSIKYKKFKPIERILEEMDYFDRRSDKSGRMTEQVQYSLLESGERGRTGPIKHDFFCKV